MTLPRPPRARTWTRGTTVLLVVCALVVSVAVAAAVLLPGYVRDGARRDAESTLRAFLSDAAALDADWKHTASPLLRAVVPVGAPLVGERGTVDALKLSARYEIGELTFSGRSLERSDTASALVTIDYRFTVDGRRGASSIQQKVWLTRPFYYGTDEPQQVRPKIAPTAVGPWRVTGLTAPGSGDGSAAAAAGLTSDARDADDLACYSADTALEQIADSARIDGRLASDCFLGAADGADALASGLDANALLEAFPAIDRTDAASMPPELTRIDTNAFGAVRAPFTEFLIADKYVLTIAAVTTDDGGQAVRIVSIREKGAGR